MWEAPGDLASEDVMEALACIGMVLILIEAIPDKRPASVSPPAWAAYMALTFGVVILLLSLACNLVTGYPILAVGGCLLAMMAVALTATWMAASGKASSDDRREDRAVVRPDAPRPMACERPSPMIRLCLSGSLFCGAAAISVISVLVEAKDVAFLVGMAGVFAALAPYAPIEDAVKDGLVPYRLGGRLYIVHCTSVGTMVASISALAGSPASECIFMGAYLALSALLVPMAFARKDGRAALFDMDGNRMRRRRR